MKLSDRLEQIAAKAAEVTEGSVADVGDGSWIRPDPSYGKWTGKACGRHGCAEGPA